MSFLEEIHLLKLFSILIIIVSACVAFGEVEFNCPQRIIFLPQYHNLDKNFAKTLEPHELETIARSQFRIAKFIEANNQLPVFSEQATRDFVWAELPIPTRARLMSTMDMITPNGLPNRYEELDAEQKNKLIIEGGEFVQFMRGKVPVIHKTIESEEVFQKLYEPIRAWFQKNPGNMQSYSPEIKSIIYTQRERLALEQVQKYFDRNPQASEVILIYGANHNFNFYSDIFNPNCITVPRDFQKSWLGKSRTQ